MEIMMIVVLDGGDLDDCSDGCDGCDCNDCGDGWWRRVVVMVVILTFRLEKSFQLIQAY